MKVRKVVNTILTFGMILILFVSLPVFDHQAYAATTLEAKLNVNSQKIVKGKTFNLRVYNLKTNQTVAYSTSKAAIATVDSYGKVTAVSNGTATISAKIYENGKLSNTLTCEITVGPPALGILCSDQKLELKIGEKKKLSYLVFPLSTVERPVYSSNDESIATVSAGGKVTGESAGVTTVFCMIANGKYVECEVTVLDEEADEDEITDDPNDGENEDVVDEDSEIDGAFDDESGIDSDEADDPEENKDFTDKEDDVVTHTSAEVLE